MQKQKQTLPCLTVQHGLLTKNTLFLQTGFQRGFSCVTKEWFLVLNPIPRPGQPFGQEFIPLPGKAKQCFPLHRYLTGYRLKHSFCKAGGNAAGR